MFPSSRIESYDILIRSNDGSLLAVKRRNEGINNNFGMERFLRMGKMPPPEFHWVVSQGTSLRLNWLGLGKHLGKITTGFRWGAAGQWAGQLKTTAWKSPGRDWLRGNSVQHLERKGGLMCHNYLLAAVIPSWAAVLWKPTLVLKSVKLFRILRNSTNVIWFFMKKAKACADQRRQTFCQQL
ncbi:hypothetical protein M5K25_003620 [Dendrobium thyrsiflorum]|uniref:Uncharacterized protein n=1 Tax=Dendrobium thyrsiflorum TaxID=117978 RepID=A0ABD0VJH8_DENTH